MTRTPLSPYLRRTVAALTLGAIAAAAGAVFWLGSASAAPHSAAPHTTAASTTATAQPGGPGRHGRHTGSVGAPVAPDPAGGVTHIGATPADPSSPADRRQTSLADAAALASSPARDGASGLGAPRAPVPAERLLGDGGGRGGCLPEYGRDGQCLPVVPPSQAAHAEEMAEAGIDPSSMRHQWACAELLRHFAAGIPVRSPGEDPQQLDRNGDGVACGPADIPNRKTNRP